MRTHTPLPSLLNNTLCATIHTVDTLFRAKRAIMVKGNLQAESILGMRPTRNGPLYLVKWRDPQEDNTWLPLSALSHCLELVLAFQRRQNSKVARKTTTPADPEAVLHLETWIEVKEETGLVREIVRKAGREVEVRREGETRTVWVPVKDLAVVQPLKLIEFLVAELRQKELGTRA